jgi:hypothetical protein
MTYQIFNFKKKNVMKEFGVSLVVKDLYSMEQVFLVL